MGGHTNPDREPFPPYGQRPGSCSLAAVCLAPLSRLAQVLNSRSRGSNGQAARLRSAETQVSRGRKAKGRRPVTLRRAAPPIFPSLGGWGATLINGQDTFLALHLAITSCRLRGRHRVPGTQPRWAACHASSSCFLQPQAPPSTQRFSLVPTGKLRTSPQDVTLGSLPG